MRNRVTPDGSSVALDAGVMSLPDACCLQLATCYLPPATCHLLLATCYLPPVTCHLLLGTCYLLPVLPCYLLPVPLGGVAMLPDLWELYRQMLRSRLFEEAVALLWQRGPDLRRDAPGHRRGGGRTPAWSATSPTATPWPWTTAGTAPLLMRGAGSRVSCCANSWAGPTGCAAAPAATCTSSPRTCWPPRRGSSARPARRRRLRAGRRCTSAPGKLAVSFFGEGAMNQGMLLESMNLAAAWRLPVVFVCKDNGWAITSRSPGLTGGTPRDRARGFGLPAVSVDGLRRGGGVAGGRRGLRAGPRRRGAGLHPRHLRPPRRALSRRPAPAGGAPSGIGDVPRGRAHAAVGRARLAACR